MPDVLSLVNTISSTSIPVEIANAVNGQTESRVTIGGMLEETAGCLDPDIQVMQTPMKRFGGDSNFDRRAYLRLIHELRNGDYDIVHTHHNFSGSVSRVISSAFDVELVNTEHNDLRHYTRVQRSVNGVTFGLPDINIFNSQSTLSSLPPIERRLSSQNTVIYNGVDVDRIAASVDYPLPVDLPEKTLVTNVGVMTDQKNQRSILNVARLLARRGVEDIAFIIAGSGPLEADLQARTKAYGVEDSVVFTGYLPEREHVYRLLHESDMFVIPSHYEGFCVAAVEAMACKLPVVASDLAVLREVIGEDGLFVDPSQTDAFAQQIVETVTRADTDEMADRGHRLHRRAVSEFSLEDTAQSYHDVYASLVDG